MTILIPFLMTRLTTLITTVPTTVHLYDLYQLSFVTIILFYAMKSL